MENSDQTTSVGKPIYFPLQLNLENAKNSMDVEGPYHYNIFFWECIDSGSPKGCLIFEALALF